MLIILCKRLLQQSSQLKCLQEFFFEFLPDLRCRVFKTATNFQIPVAAILKVKMLKNAVQESSGNGALGKIQLEPVQWLLSRLIQMVNLYFIGRTVDDFCMVHQIILEHSRSKLMLGQSSKAGPAAGIKVPLRQSLCLHFRRRLLLLCQNTSGFLT